MLCRLTPRPATGSLSGTTMMDSTTTQSIGVVHGKKLSPSNPSLDSSPSLQSWSSNLTLSRNSPDSNVDSNGSSKNVKDSPHESLDPQEPPPPPPNLLPRHPRMKSLQMAMGRTELTDQIPRNCRPNLNVRQYKIPNETLRRRIYAGIIFVTEGCLHSPMKNVSARS